MLSISRALRAVGTQGDLSVSAANSRTRCGFFKAILLVHCSLCLFAASIVETSPQNLLGDTEVSVVEDESCCEDRPLPGELECDGVDIRRLGLQDCNMPRCAFGLESQVRGPVQLFQGF